jgi:hypothetical protein
VLRRVIVAVALCGLLAACSGTPSFIKADRGDLSGSEGACSCFHEERMEE